MKAFNIIALAAGFGLVSASTTSKHHHNMTTATNGTSIPPGNFNFEELWDLNNRFWTAFLSPNNHKQAKMVNSTLFSEDVKGKIDATRTFDGRELNTEYAFGMFSQIVLNPGSFNLLGAPVSYEIQQFAANVNIVATTLMIDFAVLSLGITYPIQVVGWFTYNAKGEVSQYDATFLRGLDWQFAQMTIDGMKKFNVTDQAVFEKLVQSQLADSICTTEVNYCKGDLQQYKSKQDCMSFLTNGTIPLGGAWQLGMDTVGCRMVHMNMVPSRPDVHCPHIGPTGGAYCNNDRQYAEYTTAKYFTNEAFTPFHLSAKVIGSLNGTVHNATQPRKL